MKVLHLGKYYPPARGGMETILELICSRTSMSVQNRVLVANEGGAPSREQRGTVEIVRAPAIAKIGAVAVCPTLPFRLRAERPDLIVLHEPNPMALLAYFLARPPATLLVWFHSEVIRPGWRYALFYKPFLRFALRRAARIVVSSPTLASSSAQLAEWRDKCVVIPFGVENQSGASFDATANRAEAIRREHKGPLVLFVGRIVPYKGIDVLLEAMQNLQATALVVGEGPERTQLDARADALGVGDRVTFLRAVSANELAALYRACDLFVLPSVTRQEAFGVVLLEAMASGKPVISTNLGTGTSWVNQHGITGLVVAPRDARALRDAIERLTSDQALRRAMGDAARERAQTMFTIDRMISSVLELYRELTDARLKGRAA